MNHIYRRVYNHARGVWQVASELAGTRRNAGRGSAMSSGVRRAGRLLGLLPVLAMTDLVSAQIVADPHAPGNQRPTVLGARGGAAVINIQAPSPAGISRNTYAQLNVDRHGAVLNNSRLPSQTRLAGTVGGNPWIGTQAAKVILNEVTGPGPSALRGHMEVAGERAHVIVANPAGIGCDGCGVINASRFTLTTGAPMPGGGLDGYRVTGGTVRIDGAGLDATHADYTDIIARAVEVNGGIWSNRLEVSAGANDGPAKRAGKPVFALDVGSLGGMYANKIVLLGTEHGMGMRNAGTIGAQAGDLVVTVDGHLENSGRLHAHADATIGAGGGVTNAGSITAANQLALATPAHLDNSGGTLQATRLVIEADALRNAGGSVAQGGTQGLSLLAGSISNRAGNIGMPKGSSAEVASASGAPAASLADGVLRIAGRLDNDSGSIDAAGIDLTTANGLVNAGGALRLRQFTLNNGDLGNRGGRLFVDGAATLRAGTILNDAGRLDFANTLALDAANFSNRGGKLTHTGEAVTALSITGTFDNSDGTVESRASQLTLAVDSLDNRGGSLFLSGDKANKLSAAGMLDNSEGGTLASNGNLTIQAGTLGNAHGVVKHAGPGVLNVDADTLLGAGGSLTSHGILQLTGRAIDLSEGTTLAPTIRVSAGSLSTAGGTLTASGGDALELTLHGAYDNAAGSVSTNGALHLLAGSLTNTNGVLSAAGAETTTLNVTDRFDNAGGRIGTKGDTTIRAATLDNTQGSIRHAGQGALRIEAPTLDGGGGELASDGRLTLTGITTNLREASTLAQQVSIDTTNLVTAGGRLSSLGDGAAALRARGTFDNTAGTVTAQAALTINATSLLNDDGSLGSTAATLNLGQFSNTQGRVRADTLRLATQALANGGGSIAANTLHATLTSLTGSGTLHGATLLDVRVLGDYTHEAGQQWQGDGLFSVRTDGTLTNQGTLQTKGELRLASANLVNQGQIRANAADGSARAWVSAAGRIDNQAGASLAGDTLTLAATDIHNSSREGITANALRIEADTLTNGRDLGSADADVPYGEGFIGAARSAELRIDRHLANRDGEIYAGGDLILAGRADGTRTATLENISGRIQAKGDASIAADVIVNRKRFIETEQVALTPDEQHALSSERRFDPALTAGERQRLEQLFRKNGNRKQARFRKKGKGARPYGHSGLSQAELTELTSYLDRLGWVRTEHVSDADLAILNAAYRRIAIEDYGQRGGYLVVGRDGNPGAAYKQVDTYLTQTRVTRESADSQILSGGHLAIDLGVRLTNHASAIAASGDLRIDGRSDDRPDARIENLAVRGHYTIRREVDALVLPPVPVRYLSRRGWKNDWAQFPAHISTDTLTSEGPVLAPSTISGRTVTLVSHDISNSTVPATGGVDPLASASPRTGGFPQGADEFARGSAPQVVGSAERPLPRVILPTSGRAVRHDAAGAPFLVTTTPRFANGDAISSDHLLRRLDANPWQIHKRLGDGYVEQDLVLDQLLQLTGRRSLNDGDAIAQYTALMDHAAAQAQSLGLRLGSPLTTSQIAALSSDIVWLVEQVVDGQAVLVPVVYLSKRTAERMRADGALIAGGNVDLKASGSVRNDGVIRSLRDTTIGADTLINTGALHADEHLGTATRGDTFNAGTLSGQGVTVQAGGSAVNAPRFDGLTASGGRITSGTGGVRIAAAGDVVQQGAIRSAGDAMIVAGNDYGQDAATSAKGTQAPAGSLSTAGHVVIVAGRDAVFDRSTVDAGQLAYVEAGRDAQFRAATLGGDTGIGVKAGQDIVSGTVIKRSTAHQTTRERGHTSSTITADDTTRGSTFRSGGDVTMQADRDIRLAAGHVQADGTVALTAGRDIDLLAGENIHSETRETRTVKKNLLSKKTTTTRDQMVRRTVVGTDISGTQGVVLDAGRDVNATGGSVRSTAGGIGITAGHEVALRAAYDIDETTQSRKTRRSGFEHVPNDKQGTRKKKIQTQTVTPRGTTLHASGPIVVASGGNQSYEAANIHSDTGSALISGGTIHFQTATKADTYLRTSSKHNVAYQGTDHRQRVDTEEVQSRITGPLTVAAAEGVTVDVGRDPRATPAQREAMLSALFDREAPAPTFIGETEDEAIARQAGQAGYAWIADLRRQPGVTWNLVDETHIDEHQHHEGVTKAAAAVITVVATVVTAGAASAAIGSTLGASSSTFAAATATAATATTAATTTAAGLGNAILSGAISGAMGGAVNAGSQGYDWKDGARKGALGGAVSGGLFHTAGSLAGDNGWVTGDWQKTALHAGAGGTASVLTGGEFWNGALSAGFAEATSPYLKDLPGGSWGQATGATASGAVASRLAGGDPEQGALNGLSGYLFNRALHPAENEAVHKLAADGSDDTRLRAVACAETQCWRGDDLGVMRGYVKEQVDAIVGTLSPDEYRTTLAQLKQAAPGEFAYTWGDGVRDDWQDGNVSTRLLGAGQWLGGGLQAAGAALTAPVTCRTGPSCHAAGYLFVGGLDASHAGARMMISGQQQVTWGGQVFGYLGLSPGAAELTYGLTQLSPAVYEAYAASKATNTLAAANQTVELSYKNAKFEALDIDGRRPLVGPTTNWQAYLNAEASTNLRVANRTQVQRLGIPNYLSPRQQAHLPPVIDGRSVLIADSEKLLSGLQDGDFVILRQPKPGQVVVDFGHPIGDFWSNSSGQPTYMGQTNNGSVFYGKKGVHIVPANPKQW